MFQHSNCDYVNVNDQEASGFLTAIMDYGSDNWSSKAHCQNMPLIGSTLRVDKEKYKLPFIVDARQRIQEKEPLSQRRCRVGTWFKASLQRVRLISDLYAFGRLGKVPDHLLFRYVYSAASKELKMNSLAWAIPKILHCNSMQQSGWTHEFRYVTMSFKRMIIEKVLIGSGRTYIVTVEHQLQ